LQKKQRFLYTCPPR